MAEVSVFKETLSSKKYPVSDGFSPASQPLWPLIYRLIRTHFFWASSDASLITTLMSPFQAISFLSLHASFPSFFGLVERKQCMQNVQTQITN